MSVEIEHKYLVKNDNFKSLASSHEDIRQGYLCREPERTVRVRTRGKCGYLTVKGKNNGASRQEFEYEIPFSDAEEMLSMCVAPVLEKTRWIVPFAGHVWEIDEFHGARLGLVTAEIELSSESEDYDIPEFVGKNITGNSAYYNSNL